jgi:TRAP-type C4-dicarboxylate transport system permease small subunit
VASSSPRRGVERTIRALRRVEDGVLALLLGAMIVLAPLQILLRGALASGITWVDPLLRALVLWLGLLGALAASRDQWQISIDVVSRVLSGRALAAAGIATGLFTAAVAGLVAFHAARFTIDELRFGSVAFAEIPVWVLASVIPFAFSAIALRHLLRAASQLPTLLRGDADRSSPEAAAR